MDNGTVEQKIKKQLDEIAGVVQLQVDPQNPDEMTEKLNQLITYSGNVAYCVAKSERLYKEALLRNYHKSLEDKPSSTVHSKVVEAMTAEENELYNLADRINAALKVSIEGLRTMISLFKSEMDNATR